MRKLKNFSRKTLDLDSIYLGNLTFEGVKPLSRIEYQVKPVMLRKFKELGLIVDKVRQVAQNGNVIEIIIISKHQKYIDRAKKLFDNKPIKHDVRTFRQWGELLGYPSCCVKFFLNKKTRYAPNNLPKRDQSLLFHWACPNCQVTKELIPIYRKLWRKTKLQYKELV